MGIGHRVDTADMKPGDFTQEFRKNGGKYYGKGHAYQIWSVTVVGDAYLGMEGSPTGVDGSEALPLGWHENVPFVIDKDTDPSQVGDIKELKTYQAIEANIGGAAGTDLSGVDITDDRAVDHAGDSASEDRRTYYRRLVENPWSENDWVPATALAEEAETRAEDDAVKQEPGGALDPLWRAIGWE